jgi:hypothetical protein
MLKNAVAAHLAVVFENPARADVTQSLALLAGNHPAPTLH